MIRRFLVALYREAKRDNATNGAAALAFYFTLAIFPAMIFVMALLPYLPVPHVDAAIMDLLNRALPASAATMFADVVTEITRDRRGGLLSLGFAGTLWAASNGMYAVMQQMNVAYETEEERSFLHARVTALGLTLLFTIVVLGGLLLLILGAEIRSWLGSRLGASDALLVSFAALRWVVIVIALLVALACIYYFAPDRRQRFELASPGGVTATLLLIAASLGFRVYVANFGRYDATYGSIGAVIVLMLWLYLAGLVIIIGAEVNAVIERYRRTGTWEKLGPLADGAESALAKA